MPQRCRHTHRAPVNRGHMWAAAIPALLVFAVFALLNATAIPREIPVWWSPRLHLASLKEIPQKLQEPVDMAGNEPGLELTNEQDQRLRVFTCSQYLDAVGNGFFPATQYDADMESFFVDRCYVLRDLQHVRPATRSYVRRDQWPANAFSELPPLLQTEDEPTLEKAWAEGKSWRSFTQSIRATHDRDNPLVLQAEDDLSSYALEILASGDFNDDGWEDLAVSGGVHAKGGTYFKSYYYILSRSKKDACMRVLSEGMAPYRLKTSPALNSAVTRVPSLFAAAARLATEARQLRSIKLDFPAGKLPPAFRQDFADWIAYARREYNQAMAFASSERLVGAGEPSPYF